MAGWLKTSVNIERPIKSLKLEELKNMACATIFHWIVRNSQDRPDEYETDPDNLLLG